MSHYEYKVVPAPTRGSKAKGVKTPEGRFAHTVETELNRLAAAGWEYQRAELLPSEERSGLTGTTTHWRTVLVLRRPRKATAEALQPQVLAPETPEPAPHIPPLASGAAIMLKDNGVEEPSDVAGMTTALRTRAQSKGPGATDTENPKVVPLPTRKEDETDGNG
jgi:hypothetical protein